MNVLTTAAEKIRKVSARTHIRPGLRGAATDHSKPSAVSDMRVVVALGGLLGTARLVLRIDAGKNCD